MRSKLAYRKVEFQKFTGNNTPDTPLQGQGRGGEGRGGAIEPPNIQTCMPTPLDHILSQLMLKQLFLIKTIITNVMGAGELTRAWGWLNSRPCT